MAGDYEELDMVLLTIRAWLWYNPGTLMAMSGQMVPHGIGCVEGNRGVISFYMQDNVHEHMDIVQCNFMHLSNVPGHC